MLGGASSWLHGCHCSVKDRVCSPVVGVEALRVTFDQAPLPLSVCPAPKELIAEASETYVLTEDLCANCVGICGSSLK